MLPGSVRCTTIATIQGPRDPQPTHHPPTHPQTHLATPASRTHPCRTHLLLLLLHLLVCLLLTPLHLIVPIHPALQGQKGAEGRTVDTVAQQKLGRAGAPAAAAAAADRFACQRRLRTGHSNWLWRSSSASNSVPRPTLPPAPEPCASTAAAVKGRLAQLKHATSGPQYLHHPPTLMPPTALHLPGASTAARPAPWPR